MTRARVLSILTGVAALAFSPLAMAEDDMNPTGGERYGGAQPAEDTTQEPLRPAEEEATPVEEEAAPMEQASPTGGDQYGAMGGDEHGAAQPAPMTIETEPVPIEGEGELYPSFGMSLSVGGGVSDFVDNDVEDVTDTGGAWDARLVIGTRSFIGLEAAYVGTAADMDALGLDDDAVLTGNGVEGLVRLNVGRYAFQPYIVGGVGWTRYDVVNEDFNTSSIEDQDDVVTVPIGAGFNARLGGGFILDGRFTYRAVFDDNMFDTALNDTNDTGGPDLDNWAATAHVGYEF